MEQNRIKQIRDFGQSIWLDFFDREIMNSGRLDQMIKEDGISGVTSNPSIFEKALSAGADYDKDMAALLKTKDNYDDIFFSLAVEDIKRATDFFKPVYMENDGNDGLVSLEVSPHLAHDTEGTIKQAIALWNAVDRKNVMIKIPATAACLPAIKKCTSEGINVNITLLFGLPRYEAVIDAYLSGLEDRVKANKSIDHITSVASFFLSRIDVMIDPLLQANGLDQLKGQVAIASAKQAYEIYKKAFTNQRFKSLESKGAKRQHLLWASTSTKDPKQSDVKYLEALIGKETINTVPLETLEAFRDHGRPANRLEDDVEHSTRVLAQLKENKVDLDAITQKLEDEGVEKFNKEYDAILAAIIEKRQKQMV